MAVVPFEAARHEAMLRSWFTDRGLPDTVMNLLPTRGLVAHDAAAAFLYETDSPLALIEGMVTNPSVTQQERGVALDDLFLALFDLAHDRGFKMVWGFTKHPQLVERAVRLGFDVVPGLFTIGSRRV